MTPIHFFAWVIRLGIAMALIGQLKSCTLIMLGLAAEKSGQGIVSYSKYSKMLTD